MKVIVLALALVTLAVKAQAQGSCDGTKINQCVTTLTDTLTKDVSIAQDKDKMCGLLQTYVDCILQDACSGASLTDEMKKSIEQQQKQYGLDECKLNLNGGAAVAPYFVTIVLAAVGTLFFL